MEPRAVRALAIGIALFCGIYVATHLEVGTNLIRFMPDGSASELAQLSGKLSDSELTRTMWLTVGAREPSAARAAARALARELAEDPEVAWVQTSFETPDPDAFFEIYFPRRLGFLSPEPERVLPEALRDAGLRERARELRSALALPSGVFFERFAGEDPLGAFAGILDRLQGARPDIRTIEGQLVSDDGNHAVILLATRGSAFDSGHQAPFLGRLEAAFERLRTDDPEAALVLERAGANRFALSAEQRIKGDVALLGILAFTGVALVFLGLVGSLRGFLLVSLSPFAGILAATTCGLLAFGHLDGLTMAFGASLMGVAVDYSIHLLVHRSFAPQETPGAVVQRLRPSLVLGALTTMASFAGLLATSFPALRQMAFFSIVGLAGGLLATLFFLPAWLESPTPLPERARRLAFALGARVRELERHRGALVALPALVVFLAPLLLPRLEWQDDLSQLTSFDPALIEEDRRVRGRVAQFETSRFVIALGEHEQAALERGDRVFAALENARRAGELEAQRSIHHFVWSEDLQRRNLSVLAAQEDLAARVDRAFSAEGFRPGAFEAFGAVLEKAPAPPLRPQDLDGTPLARLRSAHLVRLADGQETAHVTFLRGVDRPEALAARLRDLEGVTLFDQKGFVNEIYRSFREATLAQIAIGCGLVLGILLVRYRRLRPSIAAFLPSALVAILLLEGFVLAGVRANLFHVMSLIMVMGMGVDYGIFLVDSGLDRERFAATLLSLLLSCLTTAFVFGSLAVSSQPSLQAIGVTSGVGILLAFALAPVSLVVARRS